MEVVTMGAPLPASWVEIVCANDSDLRQHEMATMWLDCSKPT
jgi:hypothetical protein